MFAFGTSEVNKNTTSSLPKSATVLEFSKQDSQNWRNGVDNLQNSFLMTAHSLNTVEPKFCMGYMDVMAVCSCESINRFFEIISICKEQSQRWDNTGEPTVVGTKEPRRIRHAGKCVAMEGMALEKRDKEKSAEKETCACRAALSHQRIRQTSW